MRILIAKVKWGLKSEMSNLVGYARVSTRDQDYNGQQSELEAAGCTRIYREKESGAGPIDRSCARPSPS